MAPITTFLYAAVSAILILSPVDARLHETRSRAIARSIHAGKAVVSNDSAPYLEARDEGVEVVERGMEVRCDGHKKKHRKTKNSSKKTSSSSSSSSSSQSSNSNSNSDSSSSTSSSSTSGLVSKLGLSIGGKFKQTNVDSIGFGSGVLSGIGSWFEADSTQDSTNGRSWCGIEYTNDTPGFAAKFGTISPSHATYSGNPNQWRADGDRICGAEANVCFNGKCQLMYLIDAFDDQWVRSEDSIDILKGAWANLKGYSTDNKNDVMQPVTWQLTGRMNTDFSFRG